MKTKDVIERLCSESTLSKSQIETLMSALPEAIKYFAKELDSVAIPGFGTFTSEKIDERVVEDTESGIRKLLPPSITVNFKSSIVLRKKFVG